MEYISARTVADIFETTPKSVLMGRGIFARLKKYRLGTGPRARVRYDKAEVEALLTPPEKPGAPPRLIIGNHPRLLTRRRRKPRLTQDDSNL